MFKTRKQEILDDIINDMTSKDKKEFIENFNNNIVFIEAIIYVNSGETYTYKGYPFWRDINPTQKFVKTQTTRCSYKNYFISIGDITKIEEIENGTKTNNF